MNMQAYIEDILTANPEFVREMDARVVTEYAEQIRETKAAYAARIDAARQAWCANRGEEAYEANKECIIERIAGSIPRYAYIKHVELGGDVFEVEVDLLAGTWSISPV